MSALQAFVNQKVMIVTSDGRILTGHLTGFDQTINLIISEVDEKLFSMEGTQVTKVDGAYLVRGDNIAVIGLVDLEIYDQIDWAQVKAEGIKPTRTY
ncbi:hypothetical protein PORY_002188 [Pneumocystis oryctolagi]|uniref:Uncharacterized protein n=1 Tax=Pneumocystis oryctolagi TaxID=42067 RepID=A0ACB7CC21_9ASCO|nr:hypothetical protein PORY_002188 [Pneumocystis oryctolagi]